MLWWSSWYLKCFRTQKYRPVVWNSDLNISINTAAAAAAVKSLQSSPTLWDPIDGSLPGSPVSRQEHWRWVAISINTTDDLFWKFYHFALKLLFFFVSQKGSFFAFSHWIPVSNFFFLKKSLISSCFLLSLSFNYKFFIHYPNPIFPVLDTHCQQEVTFL